MSADKPYVIYNQDSGDKIEVCRYATQSEAIDHMRRFPADYALKEVRLKRSAEVVAHNCPACGRVFSGELALANHVEAAH